MATGLQSWSKTAASNATADSNVNWAEGQSPGSVNNSARAEMASAAMWRDDNAGTITTGGTSTAYTFTSNQTLTLTDGVTVALQMHAANGTAPTLNGDTTGGKPIQKVSGTAVPDGYLLLNGVYTFTYRSSPDAWIVRSPVNAYTVGGTDVAIADGGTGQSTSTAGFDALAPTATRGDTIYRGASNNVRLAIGAANTVKVTDGTDPSWAKIVAANITDATITAAKLASAVYAAKADMETPASTTLLPSPGVQHYHPGHPKAWAFVAQGTTAITTDYGCASVSDDGTGLFTLTFDTAFSASGAYTCGGGYARSASGTNIVTLYSGATETKTASTMQFHTALAGTSSSTDSPESSMTLVGDQ